MNLSDVMTIMGMIGSLLLVILGGALWVMQLVNKVTVRATNTERDIDDLKGRVVKLEINGDKLDEKIEKGFIRSIHLPAFKSALQDIMLQIERHRSKGEAGAFDLLLESNKEILHQLKERK